MLWAILVILLILGFLGSVFIEPEAQVLFRLWFRLFTMSAKGSRQAACLPGIEIQHSGTLSPIASAVMMLVGAGLMIAGK